jgi:DNA helicase-2/ATP-dependent DNA helicase PcrA
MQNAYLQQLNDAQRAAVEHLKGPMMIIAGAGSGKTRVLTYRIAHLIQNSVDPFNILALTFTNKAARDMKDRVSKVVGPSEAKNLWMGTFHAIFARILRSEADKLGYPSNFTIYDMQDANRLISSIIKELALDKDIYKTKQVLGRISSFKNNLVTVKAYHNSLELMEADKMSQRPRLGEIYHHYVERCFKSGAMDFDDLLLRTNELLTRFPEVLMKYQERFKYLLVDEYQDTNHSQYLIVRALADRFQNICVVGDDSQSIYGFRGANIQNILNFQRDYDDAAVFKLEQNYRSSKNIVEAANSLIEKNRTKLDKQVWTSNEPGELVKVMRTFTEAEEGRFLADEIFDNKMHRQLSNSDFAILYRTNAQSRAIEDALRKKGLKYRIYGGLSFYQRKEIKDVLAYLRLIQNAKDEEAFKRVINYPIRGIGATTINKLSVAANQHKISMFELVAELENYALALNANTKNKLTDFVTMIQHFQVEDKQKNAFELADYVVKKTGLVRDLQKDGTPEGISSIENVQELLNGLKDFVEEQTNKQESTSLATFLEDVALATDFDNEKKDTEPRISLMTIHLAKGLEFPCVFIVGLEENLFPSAMSMNSRNEVEEERRLFYVALTRAEKLAYLSYANTRYRWGKLTDAEPSRFLDEIDEKYLHYLSPKSSGGSSNRFVNEHIFDEEPKNNIRFKKPLQKTGAIKSNPIPPPSIPKNLKKASGVIQAISNATVMGIAEGSMVSHVKFGKGKVVSIEGEGVNQKASVQFASVGVKNLLLHYAKLKVHK